MDNMKLGPYDLNTIITGDARILAEAVPDESVDLIFTDPVYQRIDDYRWLAEMAARVLKPDSVCLVWTATPLLSQVIKAMEPPLDYAWMLYLKYFGRPRPGKTGICTVAQCLWLGKGNSKTYRKISDYEYYSGFRGGKSKRHKWSKPTKAINKWLGAFTRHDAIVFDPFSGSAIVPACCKMLDRSYLAFEIDPDTAEQARERVAQTQPPLPGINTTQMSFDQLLDKGQS